MNWFRRLSWTAAVATYGLIVLGGVVRITGSGLGCGDHWPKCNGRWFPSLSNAQQMIEWNHRLLALVVTVLVTALMVMAFLLRRQAKNDAVSGGEARDAPGREAYMAFGLLETQIALGAVVVKLQLPAWSVVLHFATAMLLLATLITAGLGRPRAAAGGRGDILVGLAFVAVVLGALVANTGANRACWGFPLCNSELWPAGWAAQLQWIHRLVAYGLTGYVIWLVGFHSRRGDRATSRAAWLLLGAIVVQIAVGALMVLEALPTGLRALHLALGALVWAAAVANGAAQEPARADASHAEEPAPAIEALDRRLSLP